MKQILIAIVCLIGLSVSYSYAGNLEAAKAAYDKWDYKTAFKLFSIEAKKGNAKAQSELGELYHYRFGVTQEYKKAYKWFKLAAEQGSVTAENNIGYMYESAKESCRIIKKHLNDIRSRENMGMLCFKLI